MCTRAVPVLNATQTEMTSVLAAMQIRKIVLVAMPTLVLAASLVAQAVTLEVQYQTGDRVYLNGGARLGIAVGDQLEVVRGGDTIGVLEVLFVATHSASCRIVESSKTLEPGDQVVWQGEVPVEEETSTDPSVNQVPADAETTAPSTAYRSASKAEPVLRSRVSGSLTVDWEQFTDDSGREHDFDRSSARLNLRGRNLGGLPLQLRVRSSTRSLDRVVGSDGSSSVSEDRDRLYELSLTYNPEESRYAAMVGRLRLGSLAGVGTLDGVGGEVRLGAFYLGAFGGSRAEISDFGIASGSTSYGLTARHESTSKKTNRSFLIAGVREDGETDVSREYVATQARISSKRWSFYQRAEVDLNRGWREQVSGTSSQLSTLFLNGNVQLSELNRLSISYSRFERYRTEETRFIPEELFDESRRQGLRARWTIGRAQGFRTTLTAGTRERSGDSDDATSLGVGVGHNNLFGRKYSAMVNVLSFTNEFSEGLTLTLRAGKRFRGGHRVGLIAGARTIDDMTFLMAERETQWVRLSSGFALPRGFFARAEFELSSGDDVEGKRALTGIGYRF